MLARLWSDYATLPETQFFLRWWWAEFLLLVVGWVALRAWIAWRYPRPR